MVNAFSTAPNEVLLKMIVINILNLYFFLNYCNPYLQTPCTLMSYAKTLVAVVFFV